MYANRHIKLTTFRYQMDKQSDTVNNQIRFQINHKIYFIRPKYFGFQTSSRNHKNLFKICPTNARNMKLLQMIDIDKKQ